jgi:hypothetical protein
MVAQSHTFWLNFFRHVRGGGQARPALVDRSTPFYKHSL